MTRYKLIGGGHVQKDQDGKLKEYSRGDIIESDDNLMSLFRGKFEKVYSDQQIIDSQTKDKAVKVKVSQSVVDATKALEEAKAAEAAKNANDADAAKKAIRLGPDMTNLFLITKGTQYRVHQMGTGYQVVNGSGELMNPEGLFTKQEVNIFIDSNKNA